VLDLNATSEWFLDRAEVAARTDPGTRRALSRFGAHVRQRARTSIRVRKAVAAPGSPPSSHEGTLRRLVFFSFDPRRGSVVIGPTLAKGGEAPELLEKGGTSADGDRYAARPFMAPAFAAELPKVQTEFRDFIK
jgi:hypothetical protein